MYRWVAAFLACQQEPESLPEAVGLILKLHADWAAHARTHDRAQADAALATLKAVRACAERNFGMPWVFEPPDVDWGSTLEPIEWRRAERTHRRMMNAILHGQDIGRLNAEYSAARKLLSSKREEAP